MSEWTLSRRDAVAALAAAGVAVGTLSVFDGDGQPGDEAGGPIDERQRETVVAVARTVYPAAVSGIAEFVEAFLAGRAENRPEHARAVGDAATTLDEYAREHAGSRFVALNSKRRDALMREMGLDGADPDPGGIEPSRLRYYLVNELLFALYTSPTGGELVGIENPQGHPGGTTSYHTGP